MKDFSVSNRIEDEYRRSFSALIDRFTKTVLFSIDPFEFLQAFRDFTSTEFFTRFTYQMARRMITGIAVENAESWREAARQSMRGRMIYEALRQELQGPVGQRIRFLVNENARIISTFPESISRIVANFISQETQAGRRAETISKALIKQFPKVTKSRINLIARTEASKASTAITRARAEELDLSWYVWRTSKEMIYAAGEDAANRNMRKDGRKSWNAEDFFVACQRANKLWGKLPEEEKTHVLKI